MACSQVHRDEGFGILGGSIVVVLDDDAAWDESPGFGLRVELRRSACAAVAREEGRAANQHRREGQGDDDSFIHLSHSEGKPARLPRFVQHHGASDEVLAIRVLTVDERYEDSERMNPGNIPEAGEMIPDILKFCKYRAASNA